MTAEPWYQDGLKFNCTQCGDCCTGAPGFVWVNQAEIEAMAKVVGEDDLGRDHGVRDDHGVVLPLRLSQTDLANLIGVTRESVNLALTDFRRRGLVQLDGRRVRLLEPEGLAAIALL